MSKLIAKGDTDGFIGRAGLTPEKMDELAEAADQFDSLSKNIDDLDDVGALSRRKIIDRDVLEQRKKYLPIQNQLDEFEDTISKIDNAKNQMKKDRMDLFDAKMNERSVVFKSLEKLNGREFKRARKRQFEEIENALDELMSDSSNTRDALFIPDIFERDVKNLLKAFNASAPKALGGEYRASAQAFGGKYGSELEITLEEGRDTTLSLLLEADFTSPRGIQQLQTGRLDTPLDSSVDNLPLEALEPLQRLQDEFRSLFGVHTVGDTTTGSYEEFSQAFKADTVYANEPNTFKNLKAAKDNTKAEAKQFLADTEAQDPEFSMDVLRALKVDNSDILDLPYKDAVDTQRQLVSENLGHFLGDGYLMNHAMPTTRVTVDELLEAGGEHSVPKFIVFPSGYKTLQRRADWLGYRGKPFRF